MNYTIASDNLEVGNKKKGDQIATKELLEAGCDIAALVSGGHLSSNSPTKPQAEGAAGTQHLITPYRHCPRISLPLCASVGTKMARRMR